MCFNIYELKPSHFLVAPGLAYQAAYKNKIKLDFLTDISMFLIVERGIREGICHAIKRYQKGDNKYVKAYDKIKEMSYLKYWDVNNFYGWEMSQKLLVYYFKWVKDISEFHESFIKSYNEESDEENFLEVDIQYLENLYNLHNDLSC